MKHDLTTEKLNNVVLQLLVLTLTVMLVTGCTTSNVKKVIPPQHSSHVIEKTDVIYLDTSKLSNINVALTGLGYDGDQLAQSMTSANYAAAYQPGADPASAAIGVLIAGSILQNMERSAAIEKKNEPVTPFLTKVAALDWQTLVESNTLLNKEWSINKPEVKNYSVVTVQPELKLSSDYRNLEIVSLVIIESEDGEPLYQNYFHIYAPPFLNKTKLLSELNNLSEETLNSKAKMFLSQLEYLLDKDLSEWQKKPKKNDSIRFKNDDKQYYERGTLLAKENSFITYRTLRGEIKHIPYQD